MASLLERQLAASVAEVQARKREDIDEWLDAAPVPPKRLKRKKMNAEITVVPEKKQALARVTDDQGVSVDVVVARVEKVREVQRRIMKLGTHYGKVPGTDKDCLLKPGAEILGLTFQLDPEFSNVERWDGEHLESVVTCTLYHAPTGNRLGSGIGSCSTREKKYAWRNGGRKCPACGKNGPLTKSKDKPEWFCWRKKDGCGATFKETDERITSQKVGRVPNPDLADNYNTVRKMACKRAHVAAILFVTCASEIFTQDLDDADETDPDSRPAPTDPEISPFHAEAEGDQPGLLSADEFIRTRTKQLEKLKSDIAYCKTWEELLKLRAECGSRTVQSQILKELQEYGPGKRIISGAQHKELSKIWQHCDRQLTKLEATIKGPQVEAHFGDEQDGTEAFGPERQPGEDDQ